ncbi:MAG: hypothetical protein IM504_19685 [Microcystis sp. M038S2]|jgi:hypothetical protein|uniref:hypothetical protein n=1 Tax=unclassified Microcystis TaxID=2643300 RepID=UPI0011900D89|nr:MULTISPECIES: hypothetical protein [unclassified Microcystis]TRU59546.1 MAG: hypothetical protein EWV48_14610 [Microcystis aeruginosa Ma_QC_C_20070823_S13]TRU62243.1 MAG: hypothetical protein EWV56_07550 [Microcystis aeruginosa Ma_QC_C_20070823_S13D]MCA2685406.1 hypothetical protein [Microcystis sp. M046S2]MCA2706962.1 hypothetical protein [Microcystis sp. M038S2]MCA2953721.1 hypothetical protein [Microcystis sp. M112S1]
MNNKGSKTRKTSNKDNSFLFAEKESPRTESHMILELREKRRRASDAFDRLNADHRAYVAKFGRTWLMGG